LGCPKEKGNPLSTKKFSGWLKVNVPKNEPGAKGVKTFWKKKKDEGKHGPQVSWG